MLRLLPRYPLPDSLPCLQLSAFELLEQLSIDVDLEHCMFVAPVNECHLLVRYPSLDGLVKYLSIAMFR